MMNSKYQQIPNPNTYAHKMKHLYKKTNVVIKKPILYSLLFIIFPLIIITYCFVVISQDMMIISTLPMTSQHISHIQPAQVTKSKYLPPNTLQHTLSNPLPPINELIEKESKIILKPTMGKHRYDSDVIFTNFDDLTLKQCALFLTTLRDSGFFGDVVVSASSRDKMQEGVFDFLQYHSQRGVIVYEDVARIHHVVNTSDNSSSSERVRDFVHKKSVYDTNTLVHLEGLYGGKEIEIPYRDPRRARSLSVARYELFWVWSHQYSATSKILLIDADDTYFQLNSKDGIGIGALCRNRTEWELQLYEVHQSYRIKHLYENEEGIVSQTYDDSVFDSLYDTLVLLPVPAHGDRLAIESYCRMMVKQFDDTQAYKASYDYAYVNYLYYFGILSTTLNIDHIQVHRQGNGAVDSIDHGLIREEQEFDNSTMLVYNLRMGEGLHPSWGVYQYSSDAELRPYINEMAESIVSKLNYTNTELESNSVIATGHEPKLKANLVVTPKLGNHRSSHDAVFATAEGCDLESLILFLQSIHDSGFTGDVVISISVIDWEDVNIMNYLKYQSKRMPGLVVYVGLMNGFEDNYSWVNVQGVLAVGLDENGVEDNIKKLNLVARYDIFWAWSTKYKSGVTLLITDANKSYFQLNPFTISGNNSCEKWQLHFYKDSYFTNNFEDLSRSEREFYVSLLGDEVMTFFEEKRLVFNPYVMMGHQLLIEEHLRDMLKMFSSKKCYDRECEWAIHNFICYQDFLDSSQINVEFHDQGYGLINTMFRNMYKRSFYDEKAGLFLNKDKSVSPVVFNYHFVKEAQSMIQKKKSLMLNEVMKVVVP